MRPLGRVQSPPIPRRWPAARAFGLVWRLRSWLATTAPGGLGLTVRPYYEGLPIVRLDEGRTNGGESCRDRGEENPHLSGHGRTVPRPKIATVERREARRPASSAGDPWRSRDRPDRKAGRGCGVPHQRLPALRPLVCARDGKGEGQARRPSKKSKPPGREALASFVARMSGAICGATYPRAR